MKIVQFLLILLYTEIVELASHRQRLSPDFIRAGALLPYLPAAGPSQLGAQNLLPGAPHSSLSTHPPGFFPCFMIPQVHWALLSSSAVAVRSLALTKSRNMFGGTSSASQAIRCALATSMQRTFCGHHCHSLSYKVQR